MTGHSTEAPSSQPASATLSPAGVLEFTAPEGVVLLPVKVARCLFPGGTPTGSVVVKYVRLEKGTFVSFQPLTRGFHEAVDDSVREVLEAALATHCTLSVGDVVEAQHDGETFTLKVSAESLLGDQDTGCTCCC